jgi:transposase-like protein
MQLQGHSTAALLKLRTEAIQRYQRGEEIHQIAVRIGVSGELVIKWVRQAGLRINHQQTSGQATGGVTSTCQGS